MGGRSESTQRSPFQASEQTVKIVLAVGLVGGFILLMIAMTLFAWKQWRIDWPILTSDFFKSFNEADNPAGVSIVTSSMPEDPASNNLEDTYGSSPVTEPNVTDASNWLESTPGPLQAKPIVPGIGNQRARWTPTPLPTSTPIPSPSPMPTFVSDAGSGLLQPAGLQPDEKWIDVNVATQTLVAFEGSSPVFQSLVSTGTANHPTVKGQFRIWLRFPSQDMNGYRLGYDYYLQGVPYVQYFYQDYALHGTFWHNNFGTPMSHGCVNLPTPAAEWLFNWADYGTLVNIH